jgi:hypothetical protein
LMGGYQPGSSRQLCYSEMLGILLGTAWYPNPQDHSTVGYAVCKLTLRGTGSFVCYFSWKVHFNSLPWT